LYMILDHPYSITRDQNVQAADDPGGEAVWRLQLHRGSTGGR
jgi:hypothetical protein